MEEGEIDVSSVNLQRCLRERGTGLETSGIGKWDEAVEEGS